MRRSLPPLVAAALTASAPARAEEPAPAAPSPTPAEVRLAGHLDLGFGLPTGMLGATIEARHSWWSIEAGAGLGIAGPQWMVQGWVHLHPADSFGGVALGLGHSQGPVSSGGDLGGLFGPTVRYDNARWVNLLVAVGGRVDPAGGFVIRALFGAAINADPALADSARTLFSFGMSFGWEAPL